MHSLYSLEQDCAHSGSLALMSMTSGALAQAPRVDAAIKAVMERIFFSLKIHESMPDSDTCRFSRTGTTSPFGKLDDRIEAFKIESEVKARFAARAAQAKKPPTEFLRDVMRVVAFGPDEVKRMHGDGVDVVVRSIGGKLDGA